MAGINFPIGIGNQTGKIDSKKGPETGIPRNSGGIPAEFPTKDDSALARADKLQCQSTLSIVFDNWQTMIQKKWQTNGSSSNYLKGVAVIAKKDKAILLPVGSVVKSPLGTLFRVKESRFVDSYLTVIDAVRVGQQSRDAVENNDVEVGDVHCASNDRMELGCVGDVHDAADGDISEDIFGRDNQLSFSWPQIGWTVIHLEGVRLPEAVDYVPRWKRNFKDHIKQLLGKH